MFFECVAQHLKVAFNALLRMILTLKIQLKLVNQTNQILVIKHSLTVHCVAIYLIALFIILLENSWNLDTHNYEFTLCEIFMGYSFKFQIGQRRYLTEGHKVLLLFLKSAYLAKYR